MKIDRNLLHASAQNSAVPIPHDLLKNKEAKVSFLPNGIFLPARMACRRYAYTLGRKVSPFTLYDTEKVIFVHVPKNAGTFVNSVVYPSLPTEESTKINAHHSTLHLKKLDARQFFEYPKFAILRHPAERLRSAFDYLKFKTPFQTDKDSAAKVLSAYSDFEAFCSRCPQDFRQSSHMAAFPASNQFHLRWERAYSGRRLDNHRRSRTGHGQRRSGIQKGLEYDPCQGARCGRGRTEDLVRTDYSRDLQLWQAIYEVPEKGILF